MNIDFKKNETMKWLANQDAIFAETAEGKEINDLIDGCCIDLLHPSISDIYMIANLAYTLGMRQGKKRYIREHTKNQRRARNEDI